MSLKRDQQFFDRYSLVIGALAAVALVFFVVAMKMAEVTQGEFTYYSDEYQAEVRERLEPFGEVYMPGDDLSAVQPQVQEAAAAEPVATTLTGPQVYNEACIACHGSGIGGAPALSDASAWAARIDKGIETLQQHAIAGFQGEAGYMPPKGGRVDLSDQEIIDAVAYMVAESR